MGRGEGVLLGVSSRGYPFIIIWVRYGGPGACEGHSSSVPTWAPGESSPGRPAGGPDVQLGP